MFAFYCFISSSQIRKECIDIPFYFNKFISNKVKVNKQKVTLTQLSYQHRAGFSFYCDKMVYSKTSFQSFNKMYEVFLS